MRPLRAALGRVLLISGAACGSLSEDPGWIARIPTDSQISLATRHAGEALLGEQTRALGANPWRPRDRVVFGIEAQRGEELSSCLLVIDLIEPVTIKAKRQSDQAPFSFEMKWDCVLTITKDAQVRHIKIPSQVWNVSVQVQDRTGKQLAQQDSQIYRDVHQLGVLRYAAELGQMELAPTATRPMSDGLDAPEVGYGVVLMLFQTLLDNRAMRSVLDQLAAWPPWYKLPALLLNPGVTLHFDFKSGRPVANPLPGVTILSPLLEVPLRISTAGTSVLEIWVTFCSAQGPIGITAGAVAMSGCQPGDPGRRFRMQLIGVRRGE